ncbi:MAG: ABC transporter ATP-binding protein [Erysipelotrichales bacterium]|nr:ABC transporter ATP-binding protein [Bacilli bacterium]MEA4821884.1 ABC transporter ATP-binding protein [Erysipelotrichales bacterium]
MAKVIYELRGVSKIYKVSETITKALDNIDLKLYEGEIIVVLGPSGSGKSTLLNVLSGIDNATSGEVLFLDKQIEKYSLDELTSYRREYLGFIFQTYNLISNLDVKENIELGLQLAKDPISINEIIDSVELTSQKNKFPYQLSGGQQQRVSIARALVKNPKVLFCDEPTGALDETTGKIVLKTIQELNKKYKTTIVIITHNPSIAQMANNVIRINSGKIASNIRNEKVLDASEIRWA